MLAISDVAMREDVVNANEGLGIVVPETTKDWNHARAVFAWVGEGLDGAEGKNANLRQREKSLLCVFSLRETAWTMDGRDWFDG